MEPNILYTPDHFSQLRNAQKSTMSGTYKAYAGTYKAYANILAQVDHQKRTRLYIGHVH